MLVICQEETPDLMARSGERASADQDRLLRNGASRLMAPAFQQDRTSICCLGLERAFADD